MISDMDKMDKYIFNLLNTVKYILNVILFLQMCFRLVFSPLKKDF